MLKIGITGGIGSGKSIVCNIFAQLGVPVYNADAMAKHLMQTDSELATALKINFGGVVFTSENELDRQRLAGIVFTDKNKLNILNSLVHPAVAKDFEKWVEIHAGASYVLKEAAILFESGANKGLDYVITVSAPEALRFSRVVKRDIANLAQVKNRAQNQLPEEQRNKLADFALVNDEQQLLIPQVLKLHEHFLNLSAG